MATYKQAIDWILNNDDTDWVNNNPDLPSVTACLVADLFGKTDEQVLDSLRKRKKILKKQDNAMTNTEVADMLLRKSYCVPGDCTGCRNCRTEIIYV